MERYEANEWESYVAAVDIEAFGEVCAKEIMVAEAGLWLRDFKAGKITPEDYHNNLKKSGFENLEVLIMDVMEYKRYTGSIEFSAEDNVYFGKIIDIRSLISYEGENKEQLFEDFKGSVDDYLTLCEENGIVPETTYNGD